MTKDESNQPSHLEAATDLAHANTLLAMDRTLLAWVRTSLSLNAFGFTLAKFIHDLVLHGSLPAKDAHFPKSLGVALMLLGILGLLGGAYDYWRFVKKLKKEIVNSPWSSTMILALILATICLFLMINLLATLDTK